MKYLVTGGAGFIGSHIVDYILAHGDKVVVYDNFSTGKKSFIQHHKNNANFTLVEGDVLDTKKLTESMKGVDFVFHMAAHADVRSGFNDHSIDHVQNLEGTQSVLEAMFANGVKKIAFASTSSIYGDAEIHPTPENSPMNPTSLYGATKAACEHFIVDILKKLKDNPKVLDLLSDGTPRKSSIYVLDGVSAMFTGIEKAKDKINVINIGHDDILSVDQIVDIILEAAQSTVKKKYQGGNRGWKGDNNFVHLSNEKLKALGWKPRLSFKEGIQKTVEWMLLHPVS